MPVSPAMAERLAAGVVAHYQDAEAALIARMAKNLSRGIDAPYWAEKKLSQIQEYEKQAKRLLADLEKKAATGISTAITDAYDAGGMSAVQDIAQLKPKPEIDPRHSVQLVKNDVGKWEVNKHLKGPVWTTQFESWSQNDAKLAFARIKKAAIAEAAQPLAAVPVEPLAGLRAVEALTRETLGNVIATHPGILRSVMDGYRSVIAESSSGVLLGNQTRRQAAQTALNRFAQKGITGFVDKAGRGWTMESYTEMALRTGCGRAQVQGHVDRLAANGLDLVIVSDAPKECPLCRPWEGKVLSIGGVGVEMPGTEEEQTPATPATAAASPVGVEAVDSRALAEAQSLFPGREQRIVGVDHKSTAAVYHPDTRRINVNKGSYIGSLADNMDDPKFARHAALEGHSYLHESIHGTGTGFATRQEWEFYGTSIGRFTEEGLTESLTQREWPRFMRSMFPGMPDSAFRGPLPHYESEVFAVDSIAGYVESLGVRTSTQFVEELANGTVPWSRVGRMADVIIADAGLPSDLSGPLADLLTYELKKAAKAKRGSKPRDIGAVIRQTIEDTRKELGARP